MDLNEIKKQGNWNNISSDINSNFNKVNVAVTSLMEANIKFKGYYILLEDLLLKHPNSINGDTAWVGSPYPGTVYNYSDNSWIDTRVVPEMGTVNLDNYVEKKVFNQTVTGLEQSISTESISRANMEAELLKRVQGISENSNAYTDPFVNLGTELSSWSILNDKLNTLCGKDVKHAGHFRIGVAGVILDVFNIVLSISGDIWMQSVRGGIHSSADEMSIVQSSSNFTSFFRVRTSGAWGPWKECNSQMTKELAENFKTTKQEVDWLMTFYPQTSNQVNLLDKRYLDIINSIGSQLGIAPLDENGLVPDVFLPKPKTCYIDLGDFGATGWNGVQAKLDSLHGTEINNAPNGWYRMHKAGLIIEVINLALYIKGDSYLQTIKGCLALDASGNLTEKSTKAYCILYREHTVSGWGAWQEYASTMAKDALEKTKSLTRLVNAYIELMSNFSLVDESGFHVGDGSGNVGLRYDSNGLDAALLSNHLIALILKGIGKGEVNGIAPLDNDKKVPLANLPKLNGVYITTLFSERSDLMSISGTHPTQMELDTFREVVENSQAGQIVFLKRQVDGLPYAYTPIRVEVEDDRSAATVYIPYGQEVYDITVQDWPHFSGSSVFEVNQVKTEAVTGLSSALEIVRMTLSALSNQVNAIKTITGYLNNVSEEGFYLTDTNGNIVFRYDRNGLDAALLSDHFKELSSSISIVPIDNTKITLKL